MDEPLVVDGVGSNKQARDGCDGGLSGPHGECFTKSHLEEHRREP